MTEAHGFPGSPPTKASLASWWVKFKGRGGPKREESALSDHENTNPGIFGVPLQESIKYARVAISLTDANGNSFIYGYIPIVIAKCGVFLKDKATDVEGIFRLSGSAKRIKDLQTIFNSPEKFGKGLDWAGYTVHDAANILRRYLNQLPEPIIPLEFYNKFREPLSKAQLDEVIIIKTYQQLISELPALNRQLLLYILDLLAVFASKSSLNLMPSPNLAAIFQPGLISHPSHDMVPEEYRLSQDVLVFLINNQDHFLLGMRGTYDDAASLERNASAPMKISTPRTKTIERHPSNGSAAAESIRRQGGIRRNVSVSSKHSVTIPSPIIGTGSLTRSNTLPSKRSPVSTNTFKNPQSPLTPTSPKKPQMIENMSAMNMNSPIENAESHFITSQETSEAAPMALMKVEIPSTSLSVDENGNKGGMSPARSGLQTPTKESKFPFFSKSPGSDSEKRSGNKLRKKRLPGSSNPSAESSTASLPGTAGPSPVAHTNSLPAPPPSHPETGQPPLMPISEPGSTGTTPTAVPVERNIISAAGENVDVEPTQPLSMDEVINQNKHIVLPPVASAPVSAPIGSPNQTTPLVNSLGILSASTQSLNRNISPAPSTASTLSSRGSSHSDEQKTKTKSQSIWRKSAQKLNLGGGGSVDRAIHSPPLTSPPPFGGLKGQSSIASTTSSNSSSSRNRNRSKSVDDRLAEQKNQSTTSIPQRGMSASGAKNPETDNSSHAALGWIQKKINERAEKKDARDESKRALSPPPIR